MKKTFLIGLAVVTVAGVGAAVAFDGPAQNRPAATAAAQQQTPFAIEHMTCAKTARATYDPARATAAQIAAASTNAGYPARAVQN